MKIKEGFILRQICGEYVVVGEGLAQVNFNKMLSLNESAAYLWQEVSDKEFTKEEVSKAFRRILSAKESMEEIREAEGLLG